MVKGDIVYLIIGIVFIGMMCLGYFNLFNEELLKKEVCELKGMKISVSSDYCINGSNAYKIIQVDGKYKIIKEVVTLE